MKKQHLFEYKLLLAVFDTRHSKDDVIGVIVTLVWISLLLPLRDFAPSLVVIGQQIKEKRRGHNVPPQHIGFQIDPILNVKIYLFENVCS